MAKHRRQAQRGGPRPSPSRAQVLLLNKPWGTGCRFGRSGDETTLADWIAIANVYPAGRLDRDSEGLVVLTDDGRLAQRITHPRQKLAKRYLAQVEGTPDEIALERLRCGVDLRDGTTRPAPAQRIAQPEWLGPRDPPIRYRRHIPTTWLQLVLTEGRNRQVRRMCAAVGYPVLRLVRTAVGPWELRNLAPGQWCRAPVPDSLQEPRTRAPRSASHSRRRNKRGEDKWKSD